MTRESFLAREEGGCCVSPFRRVDGVGHVVSPCASVPGVVDCDGDFLREWTTGLLAAHVRLAVVPACTYYPEVTYCFGEVLLPLL